MIKSVHGAATCALRICIWYVWTQQEFDIQGNSAFLWQEMIGQEGLRGARFVTYISAAMFSLSWLVLTALKSNALFTDFLFSWSTFLETLLMPEFPEVCELLILISSPHILDYIWVWLSCKTNHLEVWYWSFV